jgi:hypothetical protein
MGTSSFSGPVRSENGFKTIVKNETTGAITEIATLGTAPVALADGNVTLSNAVHSGRFLIVPNGTQDNTYTLPAPVAGAYFCFVYGGVAADATDFFIDTGSDTNFFLGGVLHLDTDADDAGDEIVPVFADGNSNSKLQVNLPAMAQVHVIALNGTNWQIWGNVASATAPAFADQ